MPKLPAFVKVTVGIILSGWQKLSRRTGNSTQFFARGFWGSALQCN